MNRKQWSVLIISFYLFGMFFMYLSLQWKGYCNKFGEADMPNIFACVRGEIFAPLPYIFFGLGVVFSILSWLEPKRKRK